MELTPAAALGIFATVAMLLYGILWRVTRHLPLVGKAIARFAIALVLLLPLGLGLFLGAEAPRDNVAAPESRTGSEMANRPELEMAPAREPRARGPASRPAAPGARHRMGAPSEAPPPPPPPRSRPGTGGSPATAPEPTTAEAPPPSGASSPEDAKWDVMPVFYGTDRARLEDAPRLDYDTARGKRLQLGHALVTVPKSHEVPNIERPWVYHLPFTQIVIWQEAEDPKKHFTIKDIREMGREEFLELVRKRLSESQEYKDHAFVFVHGFNTSFEFALFRTAQMAYDLKFDGAPFLYSWPSKGQLGVQDYSYDRESAGAAEPYFREFLELVARDTGAKSVSVIAHSMGNQLLLPVLRDLRRSAPEGVQISQVILAAPDVDRDSFEFLAREIQGISGGVTLFAASNDRALTVSRQFWGGVPRAGDVPTDGPIVVPGIDTIDVTAINTEMFSLNHSGYAEKTVLLNDIQLLLQTGLRPPEERLPILERISTAKGPFWRYPATR